MECHGFTLTEYQKEELKFVFDLFSPKNGKITIDTAKQMLLKLEESSERHQYIGKPVSKIARSEPNSPDYQLELGITPFVNISSTVCFPNGSTECTFEEFASMYESIMSQDSFEEVLMHAFSLFDIKKTGLIDSKDLLKVAEILGESIQSEEESRRLLSVINPENKSGISYQEFKDFFINDIKNDEHSN